MSPEKESDAEFQDLTITDVDGNLEKGWSITRDDGWSFFVPKESPIAPAAGMRARFYGRGIGATVRGLDLDGVEVFYRTSQEQLDLDLQEIVESNRKRMEHFENIRADLDRRYESLPQVFRARLDRFRGNNPDFRWNYEEYELTCCEQAVVLAKALAPGLASEQEADCVARPSATEAISALFRDFRMMTWEQQRQMVPGLDDGHSGNSFGFSCVLAHLYLTTPSGLVRIHGAMAPLVGSKEYGCAPREVDNP